MQELSARTIWNMFLGYFCSQMSPIPLQWHLGEERHGAPALTGHVPSGLAGQSEPFAQRGAAVHPVDTRGRPVFGRLAVVSTPPPALGELLIFLASLGTLPL